MNDGAILETLQQAVTAAIAASNSPTLLPKYIGRSFTPPGDKSWLEIVWLPNNREGDFWGGEKNYRGTLRLILHAQNNDEGPYGPLDVLASVCSFFGKDKLLNGLQIYEEPNLMGYLENGTETLYPASIRYTSFRA